MLNFSLDAAPLKSGESAPPVATLLQRRCAAAELVMPDCNRQPRVRNVIYTLLPYRKSCALPGASAATRLSAMVNSTWVVATTPGKRSLESGSMFFVPLTTKGYERLDLLGHITLSDRTRLNLGVSNVFNRSDCAWSDVTALSATGARLESYAAPGRTGSANLRVTF